MHIQGRRLKSGREPQKGALYEFSDSRTIVFAERDTMDIVDVVYRLSESERGYYSAEYRPETVARDDAKVIDITALRINEAAKTCHFKLCDVKKDVGGGDVVLHLGQQWQAAYRYLYHSVLGYLDEDVKVEGEFGVITRNFDAERIKRELASLNEKLEKLSQDNEKPQMLARKKRYVSLPVLRETGKILEDVLNGKLCFRLAGQDMELPIKAYASRYRDPGEYYCSLTV